VLLADSVAGLAQSCDVLPFQRSDHDAVVVALQAGGGSSRPFLPARSHTEYLLDDAVCDTVRQAVDEVRFTRESTLSGFLACLKTARKLLAGAHDSNSRVISAKIRKNVRRNITRLKSVLRSNPDDFLAAKRLQSCVKTLDNAERMANDAIRRRFELTCEDRSLNI
jgi:hypothetical protein